MSIECNGDSGPYLPLRLRKWLMGIGLLLVAVSLPQLLQAAGTQTTLRGEDMQVDIDTRWCGCRYGGNYPVRIELRNAGKTRDVAIRAIIRDSRESRTMNVERRVRIEEGVTRKVTLSIPLVDDTSGAVLTVSLDGVSIPQLRTNLPLTPTAGVTDRAPEMLVIAKSRPDLSVYELVSDHISQPAVARAHLGRSSSDLHSEVIEPNSLPESWADYSGLDLIAVSLETWQAKEFSESAREAILKWVATGGTLIVHGVGGPARDSQELTTCLQLDSRAAISPQWFPGNVNTRHSQAVNWMHFQNQPQFGKQVIGMPRRGEMHSGSLEEKPWAQNISRATFEHRELLLGRVYAMPDDPFPGSLMDWGWLLQDIGEHNRLWMTRHGISHRRPSSKFGEFTIPHVGEVPAKMFLALITVFTLVIGPLNYFVLNRRRRLYLLLVTIPVFAALTSVSLFAYAMIADGLGVKARIRSVTLLDQKNHESVSLSRVGFYAGLSPWGGLKYSPETLVLPIWPGFEPPAPSDVDWTDGQSLSSSWLRSRTPTQFVFCSPHVERGRLEVTAVPGTSQELQVANGFTWDLEEFLVRDQSDTLFYGRNLRAGTTSTLKPATPDELTSFGNKITGSLSLGDPAAPSVWNRNIENPHSHYRRGRPSFGSEYDPSLETNYADSQGERLLRDLRKRIIVPEGDQIMLRHSYVATCAQSPGLDLGLSRVDEVAPLHVLYGRY